MANFPLWQNAHRTKATAPNLNAEPKPNAAAQIPKAATAARNHQPVRLGALQQLSQHRLQNAAIMEVLHFDGRIDADKCIKPKFGSIRSASEHGDSAAWLQLVVEIDVVHFFAGQSE